MILTSNNRFDGYSTLNYLHKNSHLALLLACEIVFNRAAGWIKQNKTNRVWRHYLNPRDRREDKAWDSGIPPNKAPPPTIKPEFRFYVSATADAVGELMPNQLQNHQFIASFSPWVTVDKCAELTGLTVNAINALRTRGKLRLDIHWVKRNGRVFINIPALQSWIEQGH